MFSIYDLASFDFFGAVEFDKRNGNYRFYSYQVFHYCGDSTFDILDDDDLVI